jgi:AAA15 family ATPase/GTPase
MLIKSIEIERFRCFHKTKAKDFGRVNLLGGKNNAGKTAFLEALFLMNEPSNQTIQALLLFRREDIAFLKTMPQRAWDNFFYKSEKENQIILTADFDDKLERLVKIFCDESRDGTITPKTKLNNKTSGKSTLYIHNFTFTGVSQDFKSALLERTQPDNFNIPFSSTSSFIISEKGILNRGYPKVFKKTHLIPAGQNSTSEALAMAFDQAKFEGGTEHLLNAFKVIDDTIIKIETLSIGKPALYIKRKDDKNYLPLSLYGDAMNKIADFILTIVNNQGGLILLDEIENGIHYTNQAAFWRMIFELAIAYDVQIFATTHSAEMIEAFKNVVIENSYQEEARYFELSRHAISKEIMVQKLSIGVLEDKLNHKKPLRGE